MIKKSGRWALWGLFIGFIFLLNGGCASTGGSSLQPEKSLKLSQPSEKVATIIVKPERGKEGEKLEIIGLGFVPGEKVLLIFTAEGMIKGKSIGTLTIGLAAEGSGGVVTADEKGSLKLARQFPAQIKPGVYPLEARGDKGTKVTCSLEILGK
jgi:hypothetical protein